MTQWTRRILSLALLAAMLFQPLMALAEDTDFEMEDPSEIASVEDDADAMSAQVAEEAQEAEVTHIAKAAKPLKVRRGPGKEYSGLDTIDQGAFVYIVELGAEWCLVDTGRKMGYVGTQYLSDIREYDPLTGTSGNSATAPETAEVAAEVVATDDFYQGYKASAVKGAKLYTEPDERSRVLDNVKMYEEVIVSKVYGDWCHIKYKNQIGYVRTDTLFKWDRIDPYVGPIPGCIEYPTMVFLKRTTDVRSYPDGKKVLQTVNPGSALCVEKPDANGLYKTPYWRTTGYVTEADIAYKMDVVPYAEAQPGDLISVMTTYYAVGVHSLQYQGRNWNIYLSTSLISGSVLQPGAEFNVNSCIGPYRKSTGYKEAPIASPRALTGYGGGTCQVNTTFYNTVIQLPIYVNHRRVHANVGAKYALKGFDAAVGGGDINMIFTNTLPYAIRFNFFMTDGVLTCCIFRAQ